MRTPRKRAQDQDSERRSTDARRKQKTTKRGVPPLSLWECGIGAVWK